MRSFLALSLLITLCGSANAATVHHPHRRHPASAFAYEPPGPPIIHYQPAPYNNYNEPYFGASQGYAPGEKQEFLDSVRRN
jgi:hypothetical protein